jgi:hypothetical protein
VVLPETEVEVSEVSELHGGKVRPAAL